MEPIAEELDEISCLKAWESANRLVDEEIVHNPQLATNRATRFKQLFEQKYLEIYETLSFEMASFADLKTILTPYVEKTSPEVRAQFLKDTDTLQHIEGYNQESGTIRQFYHLSDETLLFLYESARELIDGKKYAEATVVLKYLLVLDGNLAEAWHQLGLSLKEQLFFEKAIEAFKAASTLNPTLLESRILLVESLLSLKNFKEAKAELSELKKALEKHPEESHLTPFIAHLNREVEKIHEP